jgi:hypothetical protein
MHSVKATLVVCVLGATFGVIGAPAAQATTFTFTSPANTLGTTQSYGPINGLTITAAGFNSSTFTSPDQDLFGKNAGSTEMGLGLTNDPSTDDEITVGSYIRITMPAAVTNVSFEMGSTGGDTWAVYGASVANPLSLGSALATGGSDDGTSISIAYSPYYFFTATSNNVLVESLTMSATPVPAALPLFATGLGALGLFGWRRKRNNAAAIAAA